MALEAGTRVESLIDNHKIRAGDIGTVTRFDRWIGEEYPYVVTLEDGRSAAFARHELRPLE